MPGFCSSPSSIRVGAALSHPLGKCAKHPLSVVETSVSAALQWWTLLWHQSIECRMVVPHILKRSRLSSTCRVPWCRRRSCRRVPAPGRRLLGSCGVSTGVQLLRCAFGAPSVRMGIAAVQRPCPRTVVHLGQALCAGSSSTWLPQGR